MADKLRFPRLAALWRGWIPFLGGQLAERRQRVPRFDVVLHLTLPPRVLVLGLKDGAIETCGLDELDAYDERFDDGMEWLGTYVCRLGGLSMDWEPRRDACRRWAQALYDNRMDAVALGLKVHPLGEPCYRDSRTLVEQVSAGVSGDGRGEEAGCSS